MILWDWMIPQAEGLGRRNAETSTDSWDSWGSHSQTNATSVIENEEQFTIERPLRTAVIIFASLNVVFALITAAGILRESYKACKQNNIQGKRYGELGSLTKRQYLTIFRSLRFVLTEDTKSFPFILSCGIMVQGIVFAVVQSSGLENLMSLDCSSVSQLMLPGI